MSYFIANSITLSKDLQTFKVKGGDNNVVPRSNYWSNEIPIDRLYYDLNSGCIQLRNKTERALLIEHLVFKVHKWTDEYISYYDLTGLLNCSKEDLQTSINDLRAKDNAFYNERADRCEQVLNAYEYYQEKYKRFNDEFMKRLKLGLAELKMNKPNWIVQISGGNYILKARRNSAYTTSYKEQAQRFGKYRAILESERFDGAIPMQI